MCQICRFGSDKCRGNSKRRSSIDEWCEIVMHLCKAMKCTAANWSEFYMIGIAKRVQHFPDYQGEHRIIQMISRHDGWNSFR
ncbi:hypothetical protein M427DRAFT_54753 [Gonapodya prolifera JEL478]|uniref:Uncharacterized protein n=1 Tax=Gonapodya prolifera (strain JEL478) TaxID=1344416 RepID=A0A139AJX8_GONPJ|nr:hypothetical protein M427DRAFT_54753 [Gonapodya prolifera JEL478]|eukprot:KXS17096.1 hypothetical protein M427DRAFT_54753 [Gonapodya prolifera JEL478]